MSLDFNTPAEDDWKLFQNDALSSEDLAFVQRYPLTNHFASLASITGDDGTGINLATADCFNVGPMIQGACGLSDLEIAKAAKIVGDQFYEAIPCLVWLTSGVAVDKGVLDQSERQRVSDLVDKLRALNSWIYAYGHAVDPGTYIWKNDYQILRAFWMHAYLAQEATRVVQQLAPKLIQAGLGEEELAACVYWNGGPLPAPQEAPNDAYDSLKESYDALKSEYEEAMARGERLMKMAVWGGIGLVAAYGLYRYAKSGGFDRRDRPSESFQPTSDSSDPSLARFEDDYYLKYGQR